MSKLAVFYNDVCNTLTKTYLDNIEKGDKNPWPFVVAIDKEGTRITYQITGKKEIAPCSMEALNSQLLGRFRSAKRPLTGDEAKKISAQWVMGMHPLKDIKPVAFKNEDVWCFKRLDFATTDTSKMDDWRRFLSPVLNANALCAYIGSFFYENSSLQQYLWLYGEGMNGKSTILRFIERLLGQSYWVDQPDSLLSNRFGTSSLLGKRVCAFPDCNDQKFVTSSGFKSLTGADDVRIERKNKMPFKAKLTTKFIISSNEKPMISGQKADIRRIIFCQLPEIHERDIRADFEDCLWKERAGFIEHCMCMYEELSDQLGRVRCSTEAVEKIAEENSQDDIFELYCARVFEIDEHKKGAGWVSAGEFKVILENLGIKSNIMVKQFKDYLKTTYGITREDKAKGVKQYPGLRVKDPTYTCFPRVRLERVVTNIHEKNFLERLE